MMTMIMMIIMMMVMMIMMMMVMMMALTTMEDNASCSTDRDTDHPVIEKQEAAALGAAHLEVEVMMVTVMAMMVVTVMLLMTTMIIKLLILTTLLTWPKLLNSSLWTSSSLSSIRVPSVLPILPPTARN